MTERRRLRATEACLFLASWLAFGYFHQGGGWVQNARFATVRAIVEQGSLSPDSFLFYSQAEPVEGRQRLVRTQIVEAGFSLHGSDHRLTWPGGETSIDSDRTTGRPGPLQRVTSSAQLAYADPHFHPRQAPGLTLAAVVPYFVIFHVERALGLDPDDWWVFTVNGWLTTFLSAGLVSAIGSVLFLRLASRLWPGLRREAVWAALAFTFATSWFPNATMLHAENAVAACLLAAVYGLVLARQREGAAARSTLLWAGAAAGMAALSAYVFLVPAVVLALLGSGRSVRRACWFACGLAVPLAIGGAYHQAAFGAPFLTAFQFPHMMSHEPPALGAILERPNLLRVAVLVGSPFRGLFVTMPVLLAALPGLWLAGRDRERRAIVWFTGFLVAFLLAFAACWRDWHGGWGFGPRILIPAVPFLALGLPHAFVRARRLTAAVAIASAAVMLLVTAVDAQPPVGVSGIAAIERATWLRDGLSEFALPIFRDGRANRILETQVLEKLAETEAELIQQGLPQEQIADELRSAQARFVRLIERGDKSFALAQWLGPVSANPTGMFEPWPLNLFAAKDPQARWHSFNAGELLWPMSRSSLLPLIVVGGLAAMATRFARIRTLPPATDG